jgi:hypothetical protein
MSIDNIQKINKLAQELLSHGIVSSRDEAVRRAEQILDKKLTGGQQDTTGQTIAADNTVALQNDPDYYKNIIERTRDQVQREMKNFSEMLTVMASEIDSIKDEIRNIKVNFRPQQAQQMNTREEVNKELKEETQTKVIEQKKTNEPHPKRGNFNSGDVAIEKMFYFGNKR